MAEADVSSFEHAVQMRNHVDLENGEHLSILSRVFRIFLGSMSLST